VALECFQVFERWAGRPAALAADLLSHCAWPVLAFLLCVARGGPLYCLALRCASFLSSSSSSTARAAVGSPLTPGGVPPGPAILPNSAETSPGLPRDSEAGAACPLSARRPFLQWGCPRSEPPCLPVLRGRGGCCLPSQRTEYPSCSGVVLALSPRVSLCCVAIRN